MQVVIKTRNVYCIVDISDLGVKGSMISAAGYRKVYTCKT